MAGKENLIAIMPRLFDDLQPVLEAWMYLAPWRERGMDVGPIRLSDILLYCDRMRIAGDPMTFARHVSVLDTAWLDGLRDNKPYQPDPTDIDHAAVAKSVRALFGEQDGS